MQCKCCYIKKKKKKESIANEVADELFESLCSKYQVNLETERDEMIIFLIQFN